MNAVDGHQVVFVVVDGLGFNALSANDNLKALVGKYSSHSLVRIKYGEAVLFAIIILILLWYKIYTTMYIHTYIHTYIHIRTYI